MFDLNWKNAIDQAEALKALGVTRIYLSDSHNSDFPWHIAQRVGSGGTIRMGLPVSVQFEGAHECGLAFAWSVDLEDRGANGQSGFRFDTKGISEVLAKLPPEPADEFRARLKTAADKAWEIGEEYQSAAAGQFSAAQTLRMLAQIGTVQK